jgi:hypothetical protein
MHLTEAIHHSLEHPHSLQLGAGAQVLQIYSPPELPVVRVEAVEEQVAQVEHQLPIKVFLEA